MQRASQALKIAALAGLYLVAAKLGIETSVAQGVITPVWAPTGIALAAVLILGPRMWPGIALGAFVANATSEVSPAVAFFIAAGNTLEALLGAYLLRRVGFDLSLQRVRDVVAFITLAAAGATAVAATNGVTTLAIAGAIPSGEYANAWFLWWFGDAIGALLVAPAVLVAVDHFRRRKRLDKPVEAAFLLVLLVTASLLVFFGGNWKYPYLIFPLLTWAALRFKPLGAAAGMLVVGAIATLGTVEGAVPIGGVTATQSVQILQALTAVVGIAVFVIAATIAEKETAQKFSKSARESLEVAQAIAHVGSWEWDISDGRIWWSDELYRIYGYPPREFPVTLERVMERVLPEDRPAIERNLEAGFAAGIDHALPEIQYRVARADGSVRILKGKGALEFRDGRPVRMVGSVQDVTDAEDASRALTLAYQRERETAEQLRQLDDMKNTFISAVSHDLRTPLTTITGFAHTLIRQLERLSDDEVAHILNRIQWNGERASQMLANLLDLDRLTRGSIELSKTAADLSDLALRVVHSLEIGDRDIRVDRDPVVAWIDEGLVERVIENLLVNAVRHTPPGSGIRVRFQSDADSAQICVDDEGPGVPDELKRDIFEPFRRGQNQTAMGSGIGLFLVDQFARLHGGRAWVEDRPEGGASFRVSFLRSDATASGTVA